MAYRISTLGLWIVLSVASGSIRAQGQPTLSSPDGVSGQRLLEEASRRVAGETRYELRYRLKPGDEYRWSVEHTANSRVAQQKQTTDTSMRSLATKVWRIERIDSLGNMTLTHAVESMRLWQRVGEQEPVSFDSERDREVPAIFQHVAELKGKPLAMITVSPRGDELHRDSEHLNLQLGYGQATIPLPEEPIAVGDKWQVPQLWRVRDDEGIARPIHGRTTYELRKVADGIAYITFRNEPLTPLESDGVRAQLMHYLSRGYVAFNLSRGLIVMREVEWDCKVQGHVTPDSLMQHTAKLTERLLDEVKPVVASPRPGSVNQTPVSDR